MRKIVIAFGGNALGNTPDEQQSLIKEAVKTIVPLVKAGDKVVIGHGNGPQVGIINLAFENSLDNEDIPYMPLAECTAMSQGYIGYHLQKGIKEVLNEENISKSVVSLITQVKVDKNDPSFKNPTKPIGPFYTKEVADKLKETSGDTYVEDAGRGYRKVVASPEPIEIVEIDTIRDLIEKDNIVIAGGGGGIPVYLDDPTKGASAVIDKDKLCSLMARNINADLLVILTNIKQAQINYNTDNAQDIGKVDIATMEKYIAEGHFAKGSMLPKVEAAIEFVKETGNDAIITDLNNLTNALEGNEATIITK